jgi:hypothetical protein
MGELPTPPCPLPSPNPTPSFWLSEPDASLLGHRTTKELPAYAETVIVGSGITGASAARWMVEEAAGLVGGDGVLMLEAREACWGATGRVCLSTPAALCVACVLRVCAMAD